MALKRRRGVGSGPAGPESYPERLFWKAANVAKYAQFWRFKSPAGLVAQYKVFYGKYRLDFALPAEQIAIEIDGRAYHTGKTVFTRDRVRQRDLERAGWRVIRFSADEVDADPDVCVLRTIELVAYFRQTQEVVDRQAVEATASAAEVEQLRHMLREIRVMCESMVNQSDLEPLTALVDLALTEEMADRGNLVGALATVAKTFSCYHAEWTLHAMYPPGNPDRQWRCAECGATPSYVVAQGHAVHLEQCGHELVDEGDFADIVEHLDGDGDGSGRCRWRSQEDIEEEDAYFAANDCGCAKDGDLASVNCACLNSVDSQP